MRKQQFSATSEDELLRIQEEFMAGKQGPAAARLCNAEAGKPKQQGSGRSRGGGTEARREAEVGRQEVLGGEDSGEEEMELMHSAMRRAAAADDGGGGGGSGGSADDSTLQRPAAFTKRVRRRAGVSTGGCMADARGVEGAPPQPAEAEGGAAAAADGQQALPDFTDLVLGEIVEHVTCSAPVAPTAAADGGFPRAVGRKASKFALGRKARKAASAAPRGGSGSGGSRGMEAGAEQENAARLAAMTRAEREELQQQVSDRLTPQQMEFLRQRARRKAAAAAAPGAGSSSAVRQVEVEGKAVRVGRPGRRSADEGLGAGAAAQLPDSAAGGAAAASAPLPFVQAPPAAARLRFSLDGLVVGLCTDAELKQADAGADVLRRDILRRDEGAVPEGHSVDELLVLLRSRMPQQRVAALHCLHRLLVCARPRPQYVGANGAQEPRVPECRLPLEGGGAAGAAGGGLAAATWSEVWDYLIQHAAIVHDLRLALDDPQRPVVLAAAEALAAALAPSFEEQLVLECAASLPQSGLPAPHLQYLQRRAASAAWQLRGAPDEEGEAPADAAEVCAADPVRGAAEMRLVSRLVFVMRHHRMPAATAAALDMLLGLACSSAELAGSVVAGTGMAEALAELLEVGAGGPEAGEASEAVRVKAFRVLRALCTASKGVAAQLQAKGLLEHAVRVLAAPTLRAAAAGGAASEQLPRSPAAAALLLESLRIWQACAGAGLPLLQLHQVFPTLAPWLRRPAPPADDRMRLMLSQQAYATLAALLGAAADPDARLEDWPPGALPAVAEEALTWLAPGALRLPQRPRLQPLLDALRAALCSRRDAGTDCLPPALPAAAAACGSVRFLAAALHQPADRFSSEHGSRSLAQRVAGLLASAPLQRAMADLQADAAAAVADLPSSSCETAWAGSLDLLAARSLLSELALLQHAAAAGAAVVPVPPPFPRLSAVPAAAAAPGGQLLDPAQLAALQLQGQHGRIGATRLLAEGAVRPEELYAHLQLLQSLPPGSDRVALQALTALLSPRSLQWALTAAAEAVAAAPRWWRQPPEELAARLSRFLLRIVPACVLGYQLQGAGVPGTDAAARLPSACALPAQESALPAAADWLLAGVRHAEWLPIGEEWVSSVGLLLLLVVALERGAPAPPLRRLHPARKLQGLLQALYLPEAAHAPAGGRAPPGLELWQDDTARLAASWLTARWVPQLLQRPEAEDPPPDPLPAAAAQAVARQFSAASLGDPLFGTHAALLLSPRVGGAAAAAAWRELGQERCLHELPQPDRCQGWPHLYLAEEAPQDLVWAMATSLAGGDLRSSWRARSLPACMAQHHLLARVAARGSSPHRGTPLLSWLLSRAEREDLALLFGLPVAADAALPSQQLLRQQLQALVADAGAAGLRPKAEAALQSLVS